jgi:DNA-binding MarR family transcriptional regulator
MGLPLYIADPPSTSSVAHAAPAGWLTKTERDTLELLGQMGGRVAVSDFAAHASLEVTAAGNRLGNLAKRGYVNRVARSRREGDEFVSPAWFEKTR